ncbi:hypothetical protein, variant 2 [Aphanomyces astaci]|uniref:EGF-like domain-containing protein n=1 Tax=Aphanomyces astaci TaxID=112090 RepID=W4GY71_APHAT|nr:hypothetical protein, variant 2 [Aphanomyces astaci]ETV84665.1 hypothetical protein, variant 2 [Aphanomyces astaci]|eukprot:XP_009826357.1 hypothetical protein, variant 2 [Aphanomyces astaci]
MCRVALFWAILLALWGDCCHWAKPFTQWTEHVYGKVAGDGVEYSSFQVEKGVSEVQVTFSRSDLRGRVVAPMLYGKLGSIPTLTSYDWNFNGTLDSFWFTESIPNLKTGTYYIALWGGDLPGTINNFGIGNSTNVWYYLDFTSIGCLDPDKAGYSCNIQVASTAQRVATAYPSQSVVNTTAKQGVPITGCMDYISNLQFFSIEITSPQFSLVTTLSIPQTFARNDVFYWALYDSPANPLDPAAIPLIDGAGYLTDGNATLKQDVPTLGTYWMLVYMDAPPKTSRCFRSTGVAFTLAWQAESCSLTPRADMCHTSWLRMNEARSDPSRNQSVLDSWFLADSPVLIDVGSFAYAAGYTVHIRDNYAGSNLIMHLVTTSTTTINLANVTLLIRADGLPTDAIYDYKLSGQHAMELSARRAKTFLDFNENALRERMKEPVTPLVTVAWPMLRFPKVGKWNVVVRSSPTQSWKHMLVLQSSPCPVGMCGDHGACEVSTTYQGLVLGTCQCIYGYAGDYCDHLYLENYAAQSYFLILSNFAILPAAIVSFQRSFYVEAFMFLSLGVLSSLYHACDINWVCVVQYTYLQKLDFIFSFNSILLCLFHLSGVRPKRKAIMQFVGLTLLVILIAIDPTTMTNWLIIGGLGGGQLVIAWTTYVHTPCIHAAIVLHLWP